MSKQRNVTIRRTDRAIAESFQIALSQEGFRFNRDDMPYITIIGNKDTGVVSVKSHKSSGQVFIRGKGEFFFYIDRVKLTTLDGKKLDQPITVQFHDFGPNNANLGTILTHLTDQRESIVYHLIGVAEGFHTAPSVLHHLWKYPVVEVDGDEYKLIYRPEVMGIDELCLWYCRHRGYIRASINGNRHFRGDWLANSWTEVKS